MGWRSRKDCTGNGDTGVGLQTAKTANSHKEEEVDQHKKFIV